MKRSDATLASFWIATALFGESAEQAECSETQRERWSRS